MALFDRKEKVWIILDGRLETASVILEEIVIDTSAAARYVCVFYCGAAHVDKPAGSGFAGLETGESEGFIDAIG